MPRGKTGLCLLAAAALAAGAGAAQPTTMSVQVRQGAVRNTPSPIGSVVTTLAYGDRVEVLETKSAWFKVSSAKGSGWMHESALSRKKIVLSGGGTAAPTGASSEEMALASKGFNSDVEAQFKAQNKNVDFAAVDRMEQRKIADQEKARFIKDGALR
jgi:hypothetical protein